MKDLGSFTKPYTMGKLDGINTLCYLGASINLIPLLVFKRLKLGEANPTTVILQLVDRSFAHPLGVIEDVLVKVGKYILLADFIVLDLKDNERMLIILGHLFLVTGRALIDVQKGELKLKDEKEEAIFNVFSPIDITACYTVEVVSKEKPLLILK